VGGLTDLMGTYVAHPTRVDTITMPMAATPKNFEKSFMENSRLFLK
jgi:hypothetical protein